MRRLYELLGIGLVAGFLSALFGVGGGWSADDAALRG